ncbi:unnamed protein product [Linum tenue]|uniref:DNA-directed RNA polymerase subunit n=1 Tax=Linum tenue TaxID=586396 RepID=A0AAV0LLU6_9ROSI|nr:unnamed protein product [Linum tenue]
MEGLSVVQANLKVYVDPSQSKNLSSAIFRELSALLFKYNDAFHGVLLAYNVHAPENKGRILPGVHPFIAVRLEAKLLVFSPKPDMLLEGKVVKVTEESIHVIVLGFSSAIITDEAIRNEFKYKTKHGQGLYVNRSNRRHVIKAGTMIRFVVKSMNEETLHIYGSLMPANTGSVKILEKFSEHMNTESVTINSTPKKRRSKEKYEVTTQITEHGSIVKDAPSQNHYDREIKKSRRS